MNERLKRKIKELVATGVATNLISMPLGILFNYSKAKWFKWDVIGNSISLKADLDNILAAESRDWLDCATQEF